MDEKLHALAFRRIADLGPLTLHSDLLTDRRAFKHVGHPLAVRLAVLSEALGVRIAPEVGDEIWRHLVAEELLPRLPVAVTLTEVAHNPTFAAFVDGLSENAGELPEVEVEVAAEQVARLCLAAGTSGLPSRVAVAVERPRRAPLTSGAAALAGRTVELVLHGGDPLLGEVLAVADGMVVLSGEESVRMVPLSSVAFLEVFQLTEDDPDF